MKYLCEPLHEKTCCGVSDQVDTLELYSHRMMMIRGLKFQLTALFVYMMLISCIHILLLICSFVFANAKAGFLMAWLIIYDNVTA